MTKKKGRGWLSSIDLLPDECDAIVTWAAQELAARKSSQIDIYRQFVERLMALQGETGLAFDIPSPSSFNRYVVRLAAISRRLMETREIAKALTKRMDASDNDDITVIAAETIKTLVFELLQNAGEAGLTTKGAQELARALAAATSAQNLSTKRRKTVEEKFTKKVDATLDKVSQKTGLSAEQVAQIRRDVLGIKHHE